MNEPVVNPGEGGLSSPPGGLENPPSREGVRLVALAGYAGAGKDEAALALLTEGWQRRCFGDIIKDIFDPLVREHLGFSAHTGDRAEKARIRELLVHGGEAFYDVVSRRFFQQVDFLLSLGHRVVNTRLCRPPEARAWVARGGIILEVRRPGCRPAEPKEAEWLEEIRALGLLAGTLVNDGTVADLHERVRAAVGLAGVDSAGCKEAKDAIWKAGKQDELTNRKKTESVPGMALESGGYAVVSLRQPGRICVNFTLMDLDGNTEAHRQRFHGHQWSVWFTGNPNEARPHVFYVPELAKATHLAAFFHADDFFTEPEMFGLGGGHE